MDGELPAVTAQAIRDHLAICPHCLDQASELERVWHALGASAELEPPADFTALVIGRVRQSEHPVRAASRCLPMFQPARLAAAAALVIGLVVGASVYLASSLPGAGPSPSATQTQLSQHMGVPALGPRPPGSFGDGYAHLVSHKTGGGENE